MLSLVLGSSTHSFELMLSAFITGLAFGGLWIRRRIDKLNSPVMFLGGIQLLSLGIIGEYLSRMFVETKARPIYIVDRVYEKGVRAPSADT